MKIEILENAESASKRAAAMIAEEARRAVAERGRFLLAVSGGRSPVVMFRALADEDVPWANVHLFQVDERVAPAGDPERNLTQLKQALLDHVPLPIDHIHPMPVESADLNAGAAQYSTKLRALGGEPPVLDLVHLGIGPDGHTASLVPGDPVLDVTDRDIAITGVYEGRHRMTLTYPVLNRVRRILWLVVESSKAEALARLSDGDVSIPAGRVNRDNAIVIADRLAASQLSSQ